MLFRSPWAGILSIDDIRSPLDKHPSNSLSLPQSILEQTRDVGLQTVQGTAVPCSPEETETAQPGHVDAARGPRDLPTERVNHTNARGRCQTRYVWSGG